MQGGIDRRDMYFNPLSFACTKSRIESIGEFGLECQESPCPGLAAWSEASLSATVGLMGCHQTHLVRTRLAGLEGCGWTQQGGIRQKRLCSPFPVLLYTGGNVAAIEIPVVSVSQLKVSDALHISSCWARCHGPSDPPHLQQQGPMVPQESPPSNKAQNTWGSVHSFQPGPSPWTASILSSLQPLWPYFSVFFS